MNVSGWLFLSVNDKILNWAGSYKNNSGEISTDVGVVRQSEAFKNAIRLLNNSEKAVKAAAKNVRVGLVKIKKSKRRSFARK